MFIRIYIPGGQNHHLAGAMGAGKTYFMIGEGRTEGGHQPCWKLEKKQRTRTHVELKGGVTEEYSGGRGDEDGERIRHGWQGRKGSGVV